ncbi:MAG: hypothetical protein ACRC1P_00330 [Cellulosilyticaceae bacterium]
MTNLENNSGSEYMPLRSKKKKKKKVVVGMGLAVLIAGVVIFNKEKIEQSLIGTNAQNDHPYIQLSKEELIQKVEVLEEKNNLLQAEIQAEGEEKVRLLKKIEGLQTYENRYNDFLEQKKSWDIQIARSNPKLFIEQYESMYPEHADEIYKELKQKSQLTKEQKEYAKVIGEMDEVQAAKALEKIVPTDPELVKKLFEGMPNERQSLILSEMTTQVAAQTIKLLSPDVEKELP